MLEDALVNPVLRLGGEGVVPRQVGSAVLLADGVVRGEVCGDVGLRRGTDPGEEGEEKRGREEDAVHHRAVELGLKV